MNKKETLKTIKIGFIFLSILLFWGFYDMTVGDVLQQKFGTSSTFAGVILSLDKFMAMLLLPFFGALSDNLKSKSGRRTPFIVVGTILAAISFCIAGLADNLAVFLVFLIITIFAMCIYRTPAVAIMPDVTVSQNRTKANALINIMGGVGSVLGVIIVILLFDLHSSFWGFFATSVMILLFLFAFLSTVRENKLVDEYRQKNAIDFEKFGVNNISQEKLDKEWYKKDKSMFCFLMSVFFMFLAYRSIIALLPTYAREVWGKTPSQLGIITIGSQVLTFVCLFFIPLLSKKIGRKRSIIFGCIILGIAFVLGIFCTSYSFWVIIVFALAGIGWSIAMVNCYPMIADMTKDKQLGAYTGLYYTFSMSAQGIAAILSGISIDISPKLYFPLASVFVLISIIFMCLVKRGEEKKLSFFRKTADKNIAIEKTNSSQEKPIDFEQTKESKN